MKLRNVLSLAALCAVTACQSSNAQPASKQQPDEPTSAEARTRTGWDKVKDGTTETATGIKDNVKATACPVVGNKLTRMFYTQNHKEYERMLQGEKIFGRDKRECFLSVENALEKGYKAAR